MLKNRVERRLPFITLFWNILFSSRRLITHQSTDQSIKKLGHTGEPNLPQSAYVDVTTRRTFVPAVCSIPYAECLEPLHPLIPDSPADSFVQKVLSVVC